MLNSLHSFFSSSSSSLYIKCKQYDGTLAHLFWQGQALLACLNSSRLSATGWFCQSRMKWSLRRKSYLKSGTKTDVHVLKPGSQEFSNNLYMEKFQLEVSGKSNQIPSHCREDPRDTSVSCMHVNIYSFVIFKYDVITFTDGK